MKKPITGTVYLENLDALRFLAFFAVFVHHIFSSIGFKSSDPLAVKFIERFLLNGQHGVSFFFVLSGFLITYLLLKEKNENGKIDVGRFYFRRTLRIWPLYFLVLIIGFLLVPLMTGYRGSAETQKDLYVFFLGNFDLVKNGVGNFVTSILWSVSIEEQFYLLWPLLLGAIPLRHFTKVVFLLVLLSLTFRIFADTGKNFSLTLSYHTFSCLYSLAIGALLAHSLNSEKFLQKIREMNRFSIINFYIVGFTFLFLRTDIISAAPQGRLFPALLPVLYAFFFAFIIAEQVHAKNSFFKFGKIKLFNKLGKISYGLYCYHMLALFIVFQILTELKFNTKNPGVTLFTVGVIISFALTILLAHWSYQYFEKKFLAYKIKLSPALTVKAGK